MHQWHSVGCLYCLKAHLHRLVRTSVSTWLTIKFKWRLQLQLDCRATSPQLVCNFPATNESCTRVARRSHRSCIAFVATALRPKAALTGSVESRWCIHTFRICAWPLVSLYQVFTHGWLSPTPILLSTTGTERSNIPGGSYFWRPQRKITSR